MTTTQTEHVEAVREWVSEILAQGCQLVWLRARIGDRPIRNWESIAANAEPEKIAQEIVRAAMRDAQQLTVAEAGYLLLAYRTSPPASPSDYVNSCTLELAGKGARKPGEAVNYGEQATMAGLQTQHMRFAENLHRLVFTNQEKYDDRNEKEVLWLRGRVAELEKELRGQAARGIRIVAMQEELMDERLERELRRRRMAMDERKQDMLGEQLEQLFPVAMNRLLGGGPGKGAPMMGETLLMKLLGSFKPEQMDRIMNELDLEPGQVALLSELYLAYGEKFAKYKQKREHVVREGEEDGAHANGANGAASNGAPPPATPPANGAAS